MVDGCTFIKGGGGYWNPTKEDESRANDILKEVSSALGFFSIEHYLIASSKPTLIMEKMQNLLDSAQKEKE